MHVAKCWEDYCSLNGSVRVVCKEGSHYSVCMTSIYQGTGAYCNLCDVAGEAGG